MEEQGRPLYQNKYQQNFHPNANCIVMNDPQFHQPVTLNAGDVKGLPPHSQKIKEAIERIDTDGYITDDTLWWAIYRVLGDRCGYPKVKTDFCRMIEELNLNVRHKCEYNNWRNVTPKLLKGHVDTWKTYETKVEGAERKQWELAMKLIEYLGLQP